MNDIKAQKVSLKIIKLNRTVVGVILRAAFLFETYKSSFSDIEFLGLY
jgi:hypothetical protein